MGISTLNDQTDSKKTILNLKPGTDFESISGFIDFQQKKYPENYFYKPVGIEIEVTNECNLKCPGCPIIMDKYGIPKVFLGDKQIINTLKNCKETGIFAYSLTGGETFLKFDIVKKVISVDHGMDLYKLNSNGTFFRTIPLTKKILSELKEAGFDKKNKYIKPVMVVSIGQQNTAGVPLQNAVNLTSLFYTFFKPDEVIFSLNICDKNMLLADKIYKDFRKLYKKTNNEEFSEKLFDVRFFSLNNIPTLRRLKIDLGPKVYIKELIEDFKKNYISGGCFNIRINNTGDPNRAETLIPKCVLRPNGDLYSCQGYTYTHLIGNLNNDQIGNIIKRANKNKILENVFTKNLEGLYRMAVSKDLNVKYVKLEKAYGPCDVCKYLTSVIKK